MSQYSAITKAVIAKDGIPFVDVKILPGTAKEDREEFVKTAILAINSHQAMKEALEDLLENLDEMGLATMPGDTFENLRETAGRAKKALTLANGGTSE